MPTPPVAPPRSRRTFSTSSIRSGLSRSPSVADAAIISSPHHSISASATWSWTVGVRNRATGNHLFQPVSTSKP
ncbi:hypothetical protein [Streptomyces sp. NPDC093109]|uniref:hypothetical protein n=1 Tax=Streptomyces sp. NPDC093109 TaxID=3154977 RepID=UPI00344C5147